MKKLKTPEGKEGEGSLKDYPIRILVQHAQTFGPELKRQRLETNQVRKFLDAINQLKAKLVGNDFSVIETEVVLLKPKLAYAAARQDAVKALNRVMSEAIDKVHSKADFDRLVQLMESIIAYHKAEGGK
ncbi:type III-A CRISPR-associated protein Csm2 [Oscillatoriales cyanobacterium USR001]|nr:type III-A CRISPR-associated protein Csm2 [Oscillatoriales cyanobacterium USR001]